MKALKAEYEPKIEKKKTDIAELGEQKRDLLEFIDRKKEVEGELEFWEN